MVLSIIIVNWNVEVLLAECLNSTFSHMGEQETEVIVVDNASTDGSVEMIRQRFPQVRLITNRDNEGFARANNRAMGIMKGDLALLLNPDTVVQSEAIPGMIGFMRENPNVGIVGCKIINPDGSPQPSAFSFPTLIDDIILGLRSNLFFTGRIANRFSRRAQQTANHPLAVDWVTGACLLIRKKTIQEIGPMDDNLFLFAEDLDWCLRTRRNGWKVVYLPSVCIVHYGGESAKKNLQVKISSFYFKRLYFAQKYRGRLSLLILKVVSFVELVVKMVIVRVKRKMDHTERRSRLDGYRRAIRLIFQGLDTVRK
jgi:GT2 family glycosyltransferase